MKNFACLQRWGMPAAWGMLLAFSVTVTGFGEPLTPRQPPPAHIQTDAEIKTALIRGIVANPDVFAASLRVEVKNGRVILRGRVRKPRARGAAEAIARKVPGVRAVKNLLEVESARPRAEGSDS